MKKIKKIIPILIIFLTIGFAAVNYTLSLDGDANLTGDLEDFKVYFSRVLINGVEDNSIVSSTTTLDFHNKLTNIGQEYIVDYDITNASKYFDASITLSCTEGNEYLSVTNTFDTSNLTSLETRSGKLVLKRLKSLASSESKFNEITCTITATPVERETLGEGTITNPVNPYYIGREVSIGNEKFNVISDNGITVSMLAKYHIGDNSKQNSGGKNITFSDSEGWEYTPGPKEIDIQQWGGESKTRVNNYVAYLKDEYKIDVYGNLISLNELSALGCTISQNYSYGDGNWSCTDSKNSNWLINNQYWWTSSASPDSPQKVWIVGGLGSLYYSDYNNAYCIRPVITISKEDLEQFK